MQTYKAMSDRQLLDLTTGTDNIDPLASIELVNRQRSGRSIRLYARPRSGPQDEGVAPFVLGIEDGILTVHTGRPHRVFLMAKGDIHRWTMGIIQMTTAVCRNSMIAAQFDALAAVKLVEPKATQGFDCKCDPYPDKDSITIQLFPNDAVTWRIGLNGARKLVAEMLASAARMGWQGDDLGFDETDVDRAIRFVCPPKRLRRKA